MVLLPEAEAPLTFSTIGSGWPGSRRSSPAAAAARISGSIISPMRVLP